MRTLVIGFSRPVHFMPGAWLIQKYGNTPFSHVYLKVYSPFVNRYIVYQASHGYVNCMTYNNFTTVNWPVAEFEYEVSDERYKNIVQYCMDRLQLGYSRLGLLKIFLNHTFNLDIKGDGAEKYVCSELAARAVPEFYRGDPDLAAPANLYKSLASSNKVKRIV